MVQDIDIHMYKMCELSKGWYTFIASALCCIEFLKPTLPMAALSDLTNQFISFKWLKNPLAFNLAIRISTYVVYLEGALSYWVN